MLESTLPSYFNVSEYTPSYPIKNSSALGGNLIPNNILNQITVP